MFGNSAIRGKFVLGLLLVGACLLVLGCGQGGTAATSIAPSPTTNAPSPATELTVTDVVGREVTVKAPVERMILGEGRQLYITAMLDPENPFQRVVAWRDDLIKNDPGAYEKYKEKFPAAANIPTMGNPGSGEFSVEQAISLKPDVVLLNQDAYTGAQDSGLIDQLAQAGIPTVVIDFREKPLENTVPSTLLMGKLMGKEDRAQKFVDFYLQQLNEVYSRVDKITKPKPTVFIDRASGYTDCCGTFGRANLGLLIERAGGNNIGSDLIPGWSGNLNPEEIVSADPDVIIATGANWSAALPDGYIELGYTTAPETAQADLQQLVENRNWGMLKSVQNKRFHGIWHQFYNSPYHFVALQQFAKWLYPEEFQDIDPAANFAAFHKEFLPIDYSGTFWADLN